MPATHSTNDGFFIHYISCVWFTGVCVCGLWKNPTYQSLASTPKHLPGNSLNPSFEDDKHLIIFFVGCYLITLSWLMCPPPATPPSTWSSFLIGKLFVGFAISTCADMVSLKKTLFFETTLLVVATMDKMIICCQCCRCFMDGFWLWWYVMWSLALYRWLSAYSGWCRRRVFFIYQFNKSVFLLKTFLLENHCCML